MPNSPPFVYRPHDPLDYLLMGLNRGVVPPEWRQRWTNAPMPDPLRSAWLSATDPTAMVKILLRVQNKANRSYLYQMSKLALDAARRITNPQLRPSDDAMVKAIRAQIPYDMVPLISDIAVGPDP